MDSNNTFKSGFVNIIGNPNTGKSTFMNRMLGYDLAITTPKAQTTRHRILGIVNGPDYQIVFSDTPGIIKPAYKMQELMMEKVREALEDADIILLMTEPGDREIRNETLLDELRQTTKPVLVLINKIDLTDQSKLEQYIEHWKNLIPQAGIYPISALHGFGLDQVKQRIIELLPEGPPYFDSDQITDRSERFVVSEKIREKILQFYKQEIPYAVQVEVESFKEGSDLIRIRAVIYVERESQKGILIGRGGESLKRVGQAARKDLEQLFGKKIFLELFVKVRKDWRKDENWLRRFGYKQ